MQGLFAGGTDYSSQTIKDIELDIEKWCKFSKEIEELFSATISQLKNNNYWDKEVTFDFRTFCECVPNICKTFQHDFAIVLHDISDDFVTSQTIKLMQNIYNVSVEYEEYSWKSYKKDDYWKKYGDKNFALAEKLYQEGRDFFVTLRDVSNVISRMEDYVKEGQKIVVTQTVDQSVHGDVNIGHIDKSVNVHTVDQSVHIGDGNTINSSVIGKTSEINTHRKSNKLIWKIIIPIIVTVIGGVVTAVICHYLGVK